LLACLLAQKFFHMTLPSLYVFLIVFDMLFRTPPQYNGDG